jgi:hypothetical protein
MIPYAVPTAPNIPLIDPTTGQIAPPWYQFFVSLWQTTGSGQAKITLGQLISAFENQRLALITPTWLTVTGSPVGGSQGINGTLQIAGTTLPANQVLASPNGSQGAVSPRALVGADLPFPTAASLGGVKSLGATAHEFLTSITTAGQPVAAQPAFTDISGSLAGSQSPQGVATNSNAHAGYPGEFLFSSTDGTSATVTISHASPAVITDSGNVFVGSVVNFTNTGGSLPTGISAGTNYYVISSGFNQGVSYQISASPGGSAINTTSSGSGTQTRVNSAILSTGNSFNVVALSLTAGDWDVYSSLYFAPATLTVITAEQGGVSQTSATLPTAPTGGYTTIAGLTQAAGTEISLTLGYYRASLATTTLLYLVTQASFTTSTCQAYGIIQARRSANVY